MNKHYTINLIMVLLLALVGCSTRFVVDVSSYNTGINHNNKIFITPANKKVSITDVEFVEYSRYVAKALKKNGFEVVQTIDEADIVVVLYYDVSGPQIYTSQVPIIGPTGVASANTFGYINSSGNYYANTNYNYQYGITGYRTRQVVFFTRSIVLTAYDWQLFRKTKKEMQVWQTQIVSTGSSNDLRYVFPYMIVAAEKYIGRTTRGKVTVELNEYDSRVREYVQSD